MGLENLGFQGGPTRNRGYQHTVWWRAQHPHRAVCIFSRAFVLPKAAISLYPAGDPRVGALLALFKPPEVIARSIDKVTVLQPNISVPLADLVTHHRLPADAAFGLVATARSVGLLAHSLQPLADSEVIRLCGRYVGGLWARCPR